MGNSQREMAAVAVCSMVRPTPPAFSRRPSSVQTQVKAEVPKAKALASIGMGVAANALSTPVAQAAQENLAIMQVGEGEALLVKVAWGALMASFSFSLALVVWGRSGLKKERG